MHSIVGILVLGLCAVVQGLTIDEFYPLNLRRDARLMLGDAVSSHKISLAIPAKFYNTEYDYLWVHTDGFISFAPDMEDLTESEFPFAEALLAPFMADLNTTRQGTVYYRESHTADVLSRASSAVQRSFPKAAADFEAESAFIVTWHEVEGKSVAGEDAVFSFQSILVSNGRDTYAIFLYPDLNFGISHEGKKLSSSVFDARVGFNQGNDRYLEMYPTNNLVDYRNTKTKGEWIFQIGGEGVVRNNDIVLPEKARHGKRQAESIINVQEVNLEDEENFPDLPDYAYNDPYDYCSSFYDSDPCPANNSHCTTYPRSFCCECDSGYMGNGKVCIQDDSPVTINGNIKGVVDVMDEDGNAKRFNINSSAYHSFAITSQGRFHSAISDLEEGIGYALQPIATFGTVAGWLFATPIEPAVNGLQYTGGSFRRQVSIKFQGNSDYKFDLRQEFMGVTVNEEGVASVTVRTNFVGILPPIGPDEKVTMNSFDEQYKKQANGRITSFSTRTYSVDDKVYSYTVDQLIQFSECHDALANVPDVLNLEVSTIFLNYQSDGNVRFAMYAKVNAGAGAVAPTTTPYVAPPTRGPEGAGECTKSTRDFQCHMLYTCDTSGVQQYLCQCDADFGRDGFRCEDVDDCVGMPCQNTHCEDQRDSYTCACYNFAGFGKGHDGNQCTPSDRSINDGTVVVEETDPCQDEGICGVGGTCTKIGLSYSCYCDDGFYLGDGTCVDIDECYENRHNCAFDAGCTNTEGSFECACNPGYSGDGLTCTEDETVGPVETPLPPTPCRTEAWEVAEMIRNNPGLQDGPDGPDCTDDGSFAARQCNGFTQVCWCVDTTTGTVNEATMTQPGLGYALDCSNPPVEAVPPPSLTQCQTERWEAEQRPPVIGDHRAPVFVPVCTGAGAYEPLQYHPGGYFMCVDWNGDEVFRSVTQLVCNTPCQREEYYAASDNQFGGTEKYIPQCTETGEYARVQCDERTETCYCADSNGAEIANSRVSTNDQASATPDSLNCDRLDPSLDQSIPSAVIFAQSNTLGSVDLPIGENSVAKRLYFQQNQMAVGLAFDCVAQNLYWTDSASRKVFMAPIDNLDAKVTIASGNLKSPEGVAVDYVSRNVYWTDSGLDRIEMANLDGSNRRVVISNGLSNPRGIAIDPFNGKLYWSDWNRKNPRIMVADLDGSNIEALVSEGLKLPNDVTFDMFNRRVCFLDAGTKKVECVSPDGATREVVYNIPTTVPSQPFGLAVDAPMVYYTDRKGRKLHVVNTAAATITDTAISGPVGSHAQMFGVTIGHSTCANGFNTCSTNNGGCSHLCVPFPAERRSKCLCPDSASDCVPSE